MEKEFVYDLTLSGKEWSEVRAVVQSELTRAKADLADWIEGKDYMVQVGLDSKSYEAQLEALNERVNTLTKLENDIVTNTKVRKVK